MGFVKGRLSMLVWNGICDGTIEDAGWNGICDRMIEDAAGRSSCLLPAQMSSELQTALSDACTVGAKLPAELLRTPNGDALVAPPP
eukprot:1102319-Pelagomonas_calceolata.AAC.2